MSSIDDCYFIVMLSGTSYLNSMEDPTHTEEDAMKYSSMFVFDDAEDYEGIVYLVLPGGRKIQVSREDFPHPNRNIYEGLAPR